MALAQGDHQQYQELGAGVTNFNPLDLDEGEKEKFQKDGNGLSDKGSESGSGSLSVGEEDERFMDTEKFKKWDRGGFDDSAYQEVPEKQAEKLTLDKMIKFDKIFVSIMSHVKKLLDIDKLDLNR